MKAVSLLLPLSFAAPLLGQATRTTPPSHAAVTPVEREGGARQRFELLNQRVSEARQPGGLDLLFVGDSITEGWEHDGREVWARFYGDPGQSAGGADAPPKSGRRRSLNIGISGDRTQHVLWRLDHGNIDGIEPRVTIVMIGTNNSNGEDHTVAEIADGVRAVVAKLREKLPKTRIILLDIFPRGEQPNPQRGKNCQVNQIIARLHDGRNVFFLPIGHHFLSDDGALPRDIMPDGLHLSAKGYEIWAKAMETQVAALLGE